MPMKMTKNYDLINIIDHYSLLVGRDEGRMSGRLRIPYVKDMQ